MENKLFGDLMVEMGLSTLIFQAHPVDLHAFVDEGGHAEKRCISFAQISPKHHQCGIGVLWRIELP